MIKTFADNDTAELFSTGKCRRFPQDIQKTGYRRLKELDAATSLNDLRGAGRSLEMVQLRKGPRYSMRVNDKYRLLFRWVESNAYDAEIVDHW